MTHAVLAQNGVIKWMQFKNKKEFTNKASPSLVMFKYQEENIHFLKSPVFSPIHCPCTSQVVAHLFLYKPLENIFFHTLFGFNSFHKNPKEPGQRKGW